jgi:hypothetical protein
MSDQPVREDRDLMKLHEDTDKAVPAASTGGASG